MQNNNKQLVVQPQQASQQLVRCIAGLENNPVEAKKQLVMEVSRLMPQGRVDFRSLVCYPTIRQLEAIEHPGTLHGAIYLLVVDFNNSLNVTRKMDVPQMIEAASMLLDRCGNYRLEDYVVMFAMAKRGQFQIKFYEGIDIVKISEIEEAYDQFSTLELIKIRVENEKKGRSTAPSDDFPPLPSYWCLNHYRICDRRIYTMRAISKQLENIKNELTQEKETAARELRQKQIAGYANLHRVNIPEIAKQFKPEPQNKAS